MSLSERLEQETFNPRRPCVRTSMDDEFTDQSFCDNDRVDPNKIEVKLNNTSQSDKKKKSGSKDYSNHSSNRSSKLQHLDKRKLDEFLSKAKETLIQVKPIFDIESSNDSKPMRIAAKRSNRLSQDTLDMMIRDEFHYELG